MISFPRTLTATVRLCGRMKMATSIFTAPPATASSWEMCLSWPAPLPTTSAANGNIMSPPMRAKWYGRKSIPPCCRPRTRASPPSRVRWHCPGCSKRATGTTWCRSRSPSARNSTFCAASIPGGPSPTRRLSSSSPIHLIKSVCRPISTSICSTCTPACRAKASLWFPPTPTANPSGIISTMSVRPISTVPSSSAFSSGSALSKTDSTSPNQNSGIYPDNYLNGVVSKSDTTPFPYLSRFLYFARIGGGL